MAGRGSALARAVRFFREADVDEARAAKILVDEIMGERLAGKQVTLPFAKTRRTRTRKATPATNNAIADAPAEA